MPQKKVISFLKSVIFIILLLIGLVCIFNDPIKKYIINQRSEAAIEKTLNSKKMKKELNTYHANYDYHAVKPLRIQDVAKAHSNVPTIGKISIPSISLLLPIVPGIGEDSLSTGAGTLKKDQIMGQGNYTLASHNMNDYKTLFSPLLKIQKGEKIFLTNGQKVYEYQVTIKRYISPTEVSVLQNHSKPEITLITCSMNGNKRLLVQGPLISQYPYDMKKTYFK